MNYKTIEKDGEIYFKYMPLKTYKRNFIKKTGKDNPFGVLKNIDFN